MANDKFGDDRYNTYKPELVADWTGTAIEQTPALVLKVDVARMVNAVSEIDTVGNAMKLPHNVIEGAQAQALGQIVANHHTPKRG